MKCLEYLFSFEGRFIRSDFFVTNSCLFAITAFLRFLYTFHEANIRFTTLTSYNQLLHMINDEYDLISFFIGILMIIWGIVILWVIFAAVIKRYHDLDELPGFWLILIIIPLVNFLIFIKLSFFKGDPGPNKYGHPS